MEVTSITKDYVYQEIRRAVESRRERNIIPDGILLTDLSNTIGQGRRNGTSVLRGFLNELYFEKKIDVYPTMHGLAIRLI